MLPNDRRLVEAIGFTIGERSLVIDEETLNRKMRKGTDRKYTQRIGTMLRRSKRWKPIES